jgi:hypothetical protein
MDAVVPARTDDAQEPFVFGSLPGPEFNVREAVQR